MPGFFYKLQKVCHLKIIKHNIQNRNAGLFMKCKEWDTVHEVCFWHLVYLDRWGVYLFFYRGRNGRDRQQHKNIVAYRKNTKWLSLIWSILQVLRGLGQTAWGKLFTHCDHVCIIDCIIYLLYLKILAVFCNSSTHQMSLQSTNHISTCQHWAWMTECLNQPG